MHILLNWLIGINMILFSYLYPSPPVKTGDLSRPEAPTKGRDSGSHSEEALPQHIINNPAHLATLAPTSLEGDLNSPLKKIPTTIRFANGEHMQVLKVAQRCDDQTGILNIFSHADTGGASIVVSEAGAPQGTTYTWRFDKDKRLIDRTKSGQSNLLNLLYINIQTLTASSTTIFIGSMPMNCTS